MQLTAATGFRGMPFYFNLTTPVGRGYPNARTDDVSFVQFCFVVASAGKPIPPPPDGRRRGFALLRGPRRGRPSGPPQSFDDVVGASLEAPLSAAGG